MSIEAGTRLGPYLITSRLGAGGMGEVWRAHDARLNRDIALKVLPAELAANAQFRQRFEREARTISQMNHPHICSVYDVGDGYLAMELLEGETLRQKLDQPLPPRKAMEYGIQIANGLAAAHDKGIIHRDLKPENIFVLSGGRVKLLDFGLATTRSGGDLPDAATQARVTNPGTVMGTAGYMSPEQIRAEDVDPRTDIFALGAVLYEMLSGRRAFAGASSADTMSAILREDPPDLSGSPGGISVALDRVVRRCLEKNREERFHSAHDVAFALEAISGTDSAARIDPLPPARRSRMRLWATLAVIAALAGATTYAMTRAYIRPTAPKFTPVTFRNGSVLDAAFAPDGQTIVYTATWNGSPFELYTTRTGETESRSLGLRSAKIQGISPAGEMALILVKTGTSFTEVRTGASVLARMPFSGGTPRPVLEGVSAAAWSPDGTQMAAVLTRAGEQSVEYPLGTTLLRNTRVGHIRVSPDGDHIALMEFNPATNSGGAITVTDRNGKRRVLSSGWNHIQGLDWRPDGKEVWFTAARTGSARSLWAVDLKGRLRLLVNTPGALTLMDVGRDGNVLLNHLRRRATMTIMEPGASFERDITWLDYSLVADIAEDGKSILFTEQAEGGGAKSAVYYWDLSRPEPVRLGEGRGVALSPDVATAIVFDATDPKKLILLPTGPGLPRELPLAFTPRWATFLSDGKRALVSGVEGSAAQRVFLVDLTNGAVRPLTPPNTWLCATSPDALEFVVKDGTTGRALIYGMDGSAPRVVPGIAESTSHDFPLQWSADGRSLYVQATTDTDREAVIDLVDMTTGARTPWRRLLATDPASFYNYEADIRITRDGSAYIYSCPRFLTDLYVVEGLR